MFQKKELEKKNTDKNPNKMETSHLPHEEFKVKIITILTELGRRMERHSEHSNKEFKNIRKSKSELKNAITEMKNTPEGITVDLVIQKNT